MITSTLPLGDDHPDAPDPAWIEVAIVDNHHLFRRGLAMLLSERGIRVVAESAGGEEAVALVARLTPDVVLLGLNTPVGPALETMRRIARVSPASQVLVLSTSATARDVAETLPAGASGHLRKDASIDEIARRVRAAAEPSRPSDSARPISGPNVPDHLAEDPAGKRTRERRVPARVELTRRELEILRLVAAGRSNADIAAELVISALTVKNHVSHILAKLQISNRTAAAAYATRAGLIHR